MELRLPFAKHEVDLLFEEGKVRVPALPPGVLELGEDALQVIHAVLGLGFEGFTSHVRQTNPAQKQ
jgi:hypothetical protein